MLKRCIGILVLVCLLTIQGCSRTSHGIECEHNYYLSDYKAPGQAEDGYNEYTCSDCGSVYKEIVPSTGLGEESGEQLSVGASSSTADEEHDVTAGSIAQHSTAAKNLTTSSTVGTVTLRSWDDLQHAQCAVFTWGGAVIDESGCLWLWDDATLIAEKTSVGDLAAVAQIIDWPTRVYFLTSFGTVGYIVAAESGIMDKYVGAGDPVWLECPEVMVHIFAAGDGCYAVGASGTLYKYPYDSTFAQVEEENLRLVDFQYVMGGVMFGRAQDGHYYGWGNDVFGDSAASSEIEEPVMLCDGTNLEGVQAFGVCGEEDVRFAELYLGRGLHVYNSARDELFSIAGCMALYSGWDAMYAIDMAGDLYAYGEYSSGASLNMGTSVFEYDPVTELYCASGLGVGIRSVGLGGWDVALVMEDGSIRTWGQDTSDCYLTDATGDIYFLDANDPVQKESVTQGVVEQGEDTVVPAHTGYPIEMISNEIDGNYFCLFHNKGDLYYAPLEEYVLPFYDELSTENIWSPQFVFMKEEDANGPEIPVLQKGEDQLALVNADYLYCIPILEEGFAFPYIINANDNRIFNMKHAKRSLISEDTLPYGGTNYLEEINGRPTGEFVSCLSETNDAIWPAAYGTTCTLGYYAGTSWMTDEIVADFWYFLVEDFTNRNNYISLPVEETRNGYFLADFSALEPGRYMFFNTSAGSNKFIVDIIE